MAKPRQQPLTGRNGWELVVSRIRPCSCRRWRRISLMVTWIVTPIGRKREDISYTSLDKMPRPVRGRRL